MGLSSKKKPNHLTDRAGAAIEKATDKTIGPDEMPGPSPDPSTNLIIHDILLRSVGRLSRMTVEKALLGRRYGKGYAKQIVENRSTLNALTAYGVTKVATKSVPGALAVGTGLALKVLFDRGRSRRKSKAAGEKMLRKQADPDSMI